MSQYKPLTLGSGDEEAKDEGNNLNSIIELFAIKSAHETFLRASPPGITAKVDLQVAAGNWETFDLESLGHNTVAIKTFHNTYIRALPGKDVKVELTTTVGPSEKWILIPSSDHPHYYSFQSCHGTYLRASPGGEGSAVTLSAECGKWENFKLLGRSKPKSFKSVHGSYMRCHPGSDGSPVDLQSACGAWESFVIEKDEQKVSLRSFHGTFLCAYPGDNSKVDLQTRRGMSTEWLIIAHEGGKKGYSLQSCHGTYLTAKPGSTGGASLCLTSDLGTFSVWFIEDGVSSTPVLNVSAKVTGKFSSIGRSISGVFGGQ